MHDVPHGEPIEGEVSALARGLAVLRCVAAGDEAATLKEISEGTAIPKPTASRLVGTLLAAGLLRRMPGTERYALGPGVMALSNAYLGKLDMRAEARVHMRAFAEASGVTVHLGTRDRLEMVLLETVRPLSAALVMRIGVGDRLGLATSASGRAYLAALPAPDRERLIETLRISMENRWPAVAPQLEQAIAQYRETGYVASHGEWHPDVNAIAAPLVMPDGEIYSVNCGGPAFKLPAETLASEVAPRLLACVRAIVADTGATLPAR
ncbi:IclR family transcriptional regulator [Bordetella petrii]|uniref:IclR family transcriptional regulator n=1 Tax=Bordetella petrii TaxID=94624 RepID=UPI0037334610